jgi:hypothetical protein
MVPALLIKNIEEASDTFQQRDMAFHGPQKETMPPNNRIRTKAERLSRERDMSA